MHAHEPAARPKLDYVAYERLDLKLPEYAELVPGTDNLNRYINILPTRSTLVRPAATRC